MSSHPTDRELRLYALHEAGRRRARISRHLEDCGACQALLQREKEAAKKTRSMERFALAQVFDRA